MADCARKALRFVRSSKFKKAIDGSISIFLSIILVPVLSIACLVVDMSRYQVAQSEVAAAGDLALNTALADYDTILKDVYGLFAVSQSDEELESNIKAYFKQMIADVGLPDDQGDAVSEAIVNGLFGGESDDGQGFSSLLRMTVEDGEESFGNGVAGSSLADPAILKNQIVEYSKYRAPVNGIFSVLDGFKAIKNLGAQSAITTQSSQVDDSIGKLNEKASNLYEAVEKYQGKLGPVKQMMSSIDSCTIASTTGSTTAKYDRHIKDALSQAAPYLWIDGIESEGSGLVEGGVAESQGNKSGYKVTHDDSSSLKTLTTGVSLRKAEGSYTTEDWKNELETVWEEGFGSASKADASTIKSKSILDTNLAPIEKQNYLKTFNEQYLPYVYRLWFAYDHYLESLESDDERAQAKQDYSHNGYDIPGELYRAKNTCSALKNDLSTAKGVISTAKSNISTIAYDCDNKINTLEALSSLLDTCITEAKKTKDAYRNVNDENEALGSKVNNYTSSDAFGASMQAQYESNRDTFDATACESFINGATAIKDSIDASKSYLKSIKLDGRLLTSYKDDDNNFNSLARSLKSAVDGSSSNIAGQVNDFVSSSYKASTAAPASGVEYDLAANKETQKYYNYLVSTFGGNSNIDDSESEEKKNQASERAEQAAKNATEETQSGGDDGLSNTVSVGSLPSGQASSTGKTSVNTSGLDKKSYTGMLKNMTRALNDIVGTVSIAAENMRDNLYVTDYVFNMFSWYTQEAEWKVDGNELPVTTQSGVEISKTNNYLYKGECEYLVYGKTNAIDNVNATKTSIFVIRFAFNSIFALTDSGINGETIVPAVAIQTASGGVIPYQVPQMVMKIALALAESGIDLDSMVKGEKVPLIKDANTWTMSLKGAVKKTVEWSIDTVSGAASDLLNEGVEWTDDKVSKLMEDLQIAAQNQAQAAVEGMFSAFSSSIQNSLGNISQKAIQSTESSAKVADEIIDKALQSALSYCDAGEDEGIKSELKKIYESSLTALASSFKGKISNLVDKARNGNPIGDGIASLQEDLTKKITECIKILSGDITNMATGAISSLQGTVQGYIDQGTEAAKSKASELIDKTFTEKFGSYTGTTATSGGASTGFLSLLKFSYSDYLKVFFFLAIGGDSDATMLRVADLIQLNVANGLQDPYAGNATHASGSSFKLSEAYTYYEVNATVGLNTMFLAMPFITKKMGVEEIDSYEISYYGAQGY